MITEFYPTGEKVDSQLGYTAEIFKVDSSVYQFWPRLTTHFYARDKDYLPKS